MGNNVAILCAAHKTAYTAIPGVEIYDDKRDCRTFEEEGVDMTQQLGF